MTAPNHDGALAPDLAFAALIDKITRERGFGCSSYKEKCLRRRIAVRMRARGVHTYPDYAQVLDTEPQEYDLLLDALTINVTKLFRNWETWTAIERLVVPALWSRADQALTVWSAGCASGEESYSLAILFHRHAAARGELGVLSRVSVIGTDIDRTSLAAAERAHYADPAFADTPEEVRRTYFSSEAPFVPNAEVRAMVRFERRDLLGEPAPASRLHLITCRNVIIYFDRQTQEALFQRFYESLVPGGFLVLGKVETLLGATRSGFAPVDPRERIFRRL